MKEAWREFYRAVRLLRRMRRSDPAVYADWSRAWWLHALRGEPSLMAQVPDEARTRMRQRRTRRLP